MALPRTSYGYQPPPGARAVGWECRNDGCGTGGETAPHTWPHPCRLCGRPADPVLPEPWAHEARIHRIRGDMARPEPFRSGATAEQHVWAYKDAFLRDDRTGRTRAWWNYRETRSGPEFDRHTFEMVALAAAAGDGAQAADLILEAYPHVDTTDLDDDNYRRTAARHFVSLCIRLLVTESFLEHPKAAELDDAMRDVARRAEGVLMEQHHTGFREIGELRARLRAREGIARTRADTVDGLPPVCWGRRPGPEAIRADAAIEAAETRDDHGPLDDLITTATTPGLPGLLRARRAALLGDLPAALRELEQAGLAVSNLLPQTGLAVSDLRPKTGLAVPDLRPQILATHGLLAARTDLDRGVDLCRAGRQSSRRVTPADAALARLLLRRALRDDRPEDVHEAAALMRRRCRSWRWPDTDDRTLLREILAARAALTGGDEDLPRRHGSWRKAVRAPATDAARARLAVAWAEWAVGTGEAHHAAEAYQYVVALTVRDAVTRPGTRARTRVLAAAQGYAEEAGYWLARTGRYREAVLALETGRAVSLTEALGRDEAVSFTEAPGREEAVSFTDTPVRDGAVSPIGALGRDAGTEPGYDDIVALTGDGAVVYLAAAHAGGYALVVAANHDPQYVDLPRLDRSRIAADAERLLGPASPLSRSPRDLTPAEPVTAEPAAGVLTALWRDGLRDLVLMHARGRVVTLIPVGLLTLLPLHAAGEPDGWHLGRFSAVRYAPNARTLRRCRERARDLADREPTLLAVDVPDGHGISPAGHLRHVARETTEVTRVWTGAPARPVHACTWAEFQAAAGRHTVWHLACHGVAEPADILRSRLYFADRAVTLDDLSRNLRPNRHRLAVLSACSTNLVGAAMPNEVVGLPSALLQVGFAGVIATGWAVDDLATTYLMAAFYRSWTTNPHQPVVALADAQQWLREATLDDLRTALPGIEPVRTYADPRYWAAFAYTGA